MKIDTFIPMLSLQIFADGSAGGTGGAGDGGSGTAQGTGVTGAAAAPQMKGAKSNPLANVKYGIQEEAAPAAEVQTVTEQTPDLNAEFEKLIKGQYKEQYDARMQDTIQKRLKGSKETEAKYNAVTPILEILGKKYGVDASDVDALSKAIEADDSYFEEEAVARGMSVQQYREFQKMERENASLRRQMDEHKTQENANRLYTNWMNQAEEARKVYPSLDMKTEMADPRFVSLLRSNIDVRTAYEVLHKDEILSGAMHYAAKAVESKIAKSVAANGARPTENGMRGQSATVTKNDVSQLTSKDIAEVARRVARGERISFG